MDILLIEDHRDIAENIADYCEAAGHECSLAMDGQTALKIIETHDFDILVVDVMLPRMDGLSLLRTLRASGSTLPALMLTARDTLDDKLAGFDAGADDYLVKPFALPELMVRLTALHRRAGSVIERSRLNIGDLTVDIDHHSADRAGTPLKLNRTCFALLVVLARAAPKPVSRMTLERELWGEEPPDSDALRTHLYHLRQIVDRPFATDLIATIRGVGIRLGPPS